MRLQNTRGRLLASTIICGAALAVSAPAFAQETDVGSVVITGSRIPQPNLVGTSPVTQVTSEDLTTAGVTRVEDLINSLPQAFAAQNSSVSNGASGTATVDLRALGSVRTLVLIDGRRMGYGSPNDAAADLNQIPGGMVERVEVLTGGASAVYGSDAIAGVVNFIMKKDFEGVQIDAQYSFYQHNNDYDGVGNLRSVIAARAVGNPSQFQLPDDNVIDGYGKEVTLLLGVNAPDDRGNLTAYVTYRNNDAILQGDRDYSSCAIAIPAAATPNNFTCGGSSTAFPGRFTDFATFDFTINPATGNTFMNWSGARDQYNYGPLNYYQRPDERYSLGVMGHYEINEHFDVFTQLMFTDYSTVAQIAPSGDFFSTATINCGNPLLSASQSAAIGCSALNIANDDSTSMYIGRRNVEGGGRQDDLRYQSFRGVIGVRGAISDGWNYDFAAQYSRVQLSRVYRNDFSVTRLGRSLDVVDVGGTPTCRSVVNGTDPNCVPYDIFTLGNVTDDVLSYLQTPGLQTAWTTQQVVTFAVNGDLGSLGLQSPYADRAFMTAFGVEYRRDGLNSETDNAFSTGDLAGQGGATIGLGGFTENYDIFAEVVLPLIEGKEMAELLSLELAYRFSDYGSGVNTDTYKIAGDWAPTSDVRFRASYQRAVRAPNVIELFTAQGLNLFDIDGDPCGPVTPGVFAATLAQCQATGVPLAQYQSAALTSPAGQYQFLQGGNGALEPETADTYTYGVVLTPSFIPGLSVSIDYYDIEVIGLIGTVGADITLDACYQDNDPVACARINRSPLGQLWVGGGFVTDTNTNIGGLHTSGIDVVGNYRFSLDAIGMTDMGGMSLNFVGSWLEQHVTDPGSGAATFDCVGFYACAGNTPRPEWRHRARATWETPWDASISLTWRYTGEVEIGDPTRIDNVFEAENYWDISGNWEVKDGVVFRGGINNVFDDDPPLSRSVGTTGNGNTYPQTYDSFGRYIFMGVTLDF
ncbi:TonB-dependent siderophore receptor [Phenylobacterium sp.]|uniref:TonB-dependent receptor plug domain-containing protein n=1 Tax=Phenylobacterium sp. TaxID=1871053 RepID=UPI0027305F47|nr:TonB-dependent receptor [Phenylobacterium sp.]MDP1875151.1 TonB-dependent receptor [Phenylobacterium sp.]